MPTDLPTRPHTRWRPLRVYRSDQQLGTTVARTYGYRAACDCGWLGEVRQSVREVRADMREHECERAA